MTISKLLPLLIEAMRDKGDLLVMVGSDDHGKVRVSCPEVAIEQAATGEILVIR